MLRSNLFPFLLSSNGSIRICNSDEIHSNAHFANDNEVFTNDSEALANGSVSKKDFAFWINTSTIIISTVEFAIRQDGENHLTRDVICTISYCFLLFFYKFCKIFLFDYV
jgi:hypothetical protein